MAAALVSSASRRGSFGEPIYFFTDIGSTNDVASALAARGAPEGATVVASAQSAGRGRFGREWFSPPGAGIYVSVVCRDPLAAPYLTLAAGVAIADGILAATGLPVQIKWPNDIVVDAPAPARRRKLAGILAEAATGAGGRLHVVLGFGVNLHPAAYPPELVARATSIETELGRAPDAGAVLSESLAALAALVRQLSQGDRAPLLHRWRALAPTSIGAAVTWHGPDGTLSGTTAGIADDGALLVRVGDRVERVISGELKWT